jgi:hypothetical protein
MKTVKMTRIGLHGGNHCKLLYKEGRKKGTVPTNLSQNVGTGKDTHKRVSLPMYGPVSTLI